MPITLSNTSDIAHGNGTVGLGEQFARITYPTVSGAGQTIDWVTEATLATIKATLAAQEIARGIRLNGDRGNSSESSDRSKGTSPTSPMWGRNEPTPAPPIKVTHRWEGSVQCIYDDFFEARLTSLTDGSADVTAEFSIDDLSNDDRVLLRLGASFYVTAIQEKRSGGRIRHSSDLRFRRLGRWHEDEITRMKERSRKRRASLGFEDETE